QSHMLILTMGCMRKFAQGLALILLLVSPLALDKAQAQSTVVISQVYGAGGNSGATWRNDYIEIFNSGSSPVNLSGWSVQYASATGSSWSRTDLSGTLAAGQYYLVQEVSGGANGSLLPTPDATGTISMASGAGKVVLMDVATTITSGTSCPSGVDVMDIVG